MNVPSAPRPPSVRISTPAGSSEPKAPPLSHLMQALETSAIFAAYHKENNTRVRPEMQRDLEAIESRLSEMISVGRQITSEFDRRREEFIPARSDAPDAQAKNEARMEWENQKALKVVAVLKDLQPHFDIIKGQPSLHVEIDPAHQAKFHNDEPWLTRADSLTQVITSLLDKETAAQARFEQARNEAFKTESEAPAGVERDASYLYRKDKDPANPKQPFDPAIDFNAPELSKSIHSLKVQQRAAAELKSQESDPWAVRHRVGKGEMTLA